LPRALYDLIRHWDAEGFWPAHQWRTADAALAPLPPWDLFGPLPMSLFAQGLESRHGFVVPPLREPLSSPEGEPPWRVAWLVGPHASSPQGATTRWLDPAFDAQALQEAETFATDSAALVNLDWPPLAQASRWIAVLQRWPLVVDPDRERVALLRLFAVRARWAPYPALPPSRDIPADLACAEQRLGLADPRWLLPHPSAQLALAVIGSSGPETERRWAQMARRRSRPDVLLLPRINSVLIDSLDEARALQCWLQILASCSCTILQLEVILDGICTLPSQPARLLFKEAEPCGLAYWGEF
jgi:hypothetical protein